MNTFKNQSTLTNLEKRLSNFYLSLKTFLKEGNELLTMPVAFLLWYISPSVLRVIDPTAAASDAGIFQFLISATVAILFGHALIGLILKISGPEMYKLLDDSITEQKRLTIGQRLQFSLFYWGFLLIAWAILVAGMS